MGVASYNVQFLWIESVTFSTMTTMQGDEIWLLVGSGTGFQTASMISLERTVYKIENKMHNLNEIIWLFNIGGFFFI